MHADVRIGSLTGTPHWVTYGGLSRFDEDINGTMYHGTYNYCDIFKAII
jgi:hypothetical protein